MYYGLKYLLGIHVGLDSDLFGPVRTLERTLSIRGAIFHTLSQIGIRVIASPPDQRTLILHLCRRYSMDRCFETADF
jgi:hypothetical protein